MLVIPPCEPSEFVAGDTVQWTKSLVDFSPSAGWTLQYRLTNAKLGAEIPAANVTAAADTSGLFWNVSITPAHSSVGAGEWRLVGWVTLTATGERHVIVDEVIEILADATTVAASALQTDNEKLLAAIDARLLGRATADQESVQINGTALTRIPIQELRTWRGVVAGKIWHEQNPGRSNPVHKMSFARVR